MSSPAREHESNETKKKEKAEERKERALEEGLEGSFPASDPVSVVQPPPTKTERNPS